MNTPAPMIESRYFSEYSTQRIKRKYSEKSASLPAIGVAVSPGMADTPNDARDAEAVSFRTSSVFSSITATVAAWVSGALARSARKRKENTASSTSTAESSSFCRFFSIVLPSLSERDLDTVFRQVHERADDAPHQRACVFLRARENPALDGFFARGLF